MKGKLIWHQIILFAVLGLLTLERFLTGRFSLGLGIIWWWLGAVIGFLLVFFDRIIYSVLNDKERNVGERIRQWTQKRDWSVSTMTLINERVEQKELVMRNALFVIVWIVMGFFTMSSSVNVFARGLMLGVGVHIFFDLITDFVWDKSRFDLWFWQIKRQLPEQEKQWFMGIVSLVGLWLMWNL